MVSLSRAIAGERFGGFGGFFGFFVAAGAFVDLRDVEIGFAVGFGVAQLRAENLDGFVDLAVFAEQRRVARLHGGIFGIFCEASLPTCNAFGQIAGFAIGVHQQHARAAIFFVAEVAEFVVGVCGGLIILAVAIELAELLIKDGERAAARRKHRGLLYADDGVGEHADRVFVAALRFVQHRFVVHDFYVAGRVLAGLEQVLFGLIELVEFAVDLRDGEIVVGVVGHQVDQLLIDRQGVLIFFFGHQRLAESAQVIELRRIDFRCAAIGGFGFGEIFRLRVGVAEEIEKDGRGIVVRHVFEQRNGFGGFAFVEQKLRELFDGGLVFGVGFQDAAEDVFGFVVLVAEAIEAREPERGFGVGRLEAVDLFVLLDGVVGDFGLAAAGAQVAEAADVNAREQAARGNVVGIALEDFLGFSDGVVLAARFPIHFGEAFADHGGFRVERVGFFVEVDGLRGEVGLAGVLELLLVDVAHREVVVGARRGRRVCLRRRGLG